MASTSGVRIGRSRGGGDDHAIGAEARHTPAIQFHGKVAHAGDVALGDDDLVERLEV
jgi:hypothetical protein